MQSLPDESLLNTFKFIDLHELLKLRLVCKKWKNLIAEKIRINELNVVDHFRVCKLNRDKSLSWFGSNRLYDFQYLLIYHRERPFSFSFFNSPLFQSNWDGGLFYKLKYLNLRFKLRRKDYEKFGLLNNLKNLVHLEIFYLEVNNEMQLSLDNLEILAIYNLIIKENKTPLFIISTPKLTKLLLHHFSEDLTNLRYLDLIQFNYPKSLRHLEIEQINVNELARFENLERIDCYNEEINKNYDDAELFTTLPRLTSLNFIDGTFSTYAITEFFKDREGYLFYLLQRKEALELFDIRISAEGLLLNTKKDLLDANIAKFNPFTERTYPQLIEEIPWYYEFHYNLLKHNMRIENLEKFLNIQAIEAFQLSEEDLPSFVRFLSKLKNLVRLYLNLFDLKQSFYSHTLPHCCPSLIFLRISSDKDIDFNFLSKFNFLAKFYTNSEMNYEDVLRLLNESYYLVEVRYRHDGYWLGISKHGINSYDMGLAKT